MKNLLLTILILTFMNCKNDSARVISKTSKDAEIIYRNHYERGWMKDSIASVTFDLASDQYSKGNYQKAKELYENANVIEPNNTIILNALGDVSANLNESDESIEYFEKSLKIDSTNYATYINFGTAYNKLLKFDKSIEVLLKGLEYANDREITGYFYYNLANSYYKAKEYKSSMEFNNKALDIIKESAVREDILELKKVLLEKNN